MNISSIFSALNQSSLLPPSKQTTDQFQQQLQVSSTDPTTTVASNDSSSTSAVTPVKGKGGHHHHRSAGSDKVDSQSVLDQLSQAFGPDATDDVTAADGNVDLSKVAQLLGSKDQTQLSALGTKPLLSITA